MAARGTFSIVRPDKIDMALTIVMSIAEWKIIESRLRPTESNGEWYLDEAIRNMMDKAKKEFNFYEDVEKDKGVG